MRKTRKLAFLVTALLAALIFFVGGFFWWRLNTSPVSGQESIPAEVFVIKKGEDLSSIAARLRQAGLIRSPLAFKIFVLAKGLSGEIQAGDFHLYPSLTIEEVAQILTHGTLDIWLTFPEGWRREELARRLASNLEGFDSQEFIVSTEDLEGYLFPDTYLIPRNASSTAVIDILTDNFEKKFTADLETTAKNRGLTKRQVAIFASIVEREVRSAEDRPIVAGILLKRWRENWPLQADATVQYAVAAINNQQPASLAGGSTIPGLPPRSGAGSNQVNWWPGKLTKTDLETDSPYNTYAHKGLPPAPICSPGLASIKAVIDPEESDYWFYLSDSQGKMHYAETIQEHNQNVSQYLP